MTDRKKLINNWGPELVVKCCRYWKMHFALDGNFGRCGLCHQKPIYTNLTWDQLDSYNIENLQNG